MTLCSRAWLQSHVENSDQSSRTRSHSQLTWEDARSGAPIAKGQESRHVGQLCLTRKQTQQELEDVTSELCNFGVVVCDGTPVVDPRLHDVIASCRPAYHAQLHAATTTSPTNHARSRLQGKAGKAIDIVTLSRLWKHLSSNAKETIQSVAGPGTGNRLSLPRVAPGSICALAPQSGERKGQLCGMPLDSFGRHSHGACRAAGTRTRVHHAIRHCVANFCRKVGLNAEEEVVINELHERAHDGTVKEARMDVVVSRPGGLERWLIDVRTLDGRCATATALGRH